jgi:hypothetical protein
VPQTVENAIMLKLIGKSVQMFLVFSLEQSRVNIVLCEFLLQNLECPMNNFDSDFGREDIKVIFLGGSKITEQNLDPRSTALRTIVIEMTLCSCYKSL